MSKVSITMLRESPATSLRIMAGLAMVHPLVAQQLFSVSFMSCWDQLKDKEKENVVIYLHQVCHSVHRKSSHDFFFLPLLIIL